MIVVNTWLPVSRSVRDLRRRFSSRPSATCRRSTRPREAALDRRGDGHGHVGGEARRAQQHCGCGDEYGRFGKRHPANGTIHGGFPCYAARRLPPARPAMVPRRRSESRPPRSARLGRRFASGRHTLIAAPTDRARRSPRSSTAIDELVQEGLRRPLPDEVRVVYVSPLKALSADIHKNLAEPRRGIRRLAEEPGSRRRASRRRCGPATRPRPSARRCCARRRTSW